MMVDEADIDLVAGSSSQSSGRGVKRPAESLNPIPPRPSKRKAGPLPRDLCVRRPFSPMPSSPPSTSSPPPVTFVGEQHVRPDSPLPSVVFPIFPLSIASVDCEEESGSLVIADVENDTTTETAVENGTSKCEFINDMPSDQQPVISNNSTVQTLSENDYLITTTEAFVPSPILTNSTLLNGETKGLLSVE